MKTSFATLVAPTLNVTPVTPTANGMISLTPEQLNKAITDAVAAAMASLQAPAAAPVTPAKAPKSRKAPVTTTVNVTPVATPVAAPVASGPIDFALKGKEQECYRAAKAAVKAAGLTWNGVKGEGSKGGKFENPTAYWNAYWTGYNTKAVEIGAPVHATK